ncbi:hypothetical protein BDR26DRAFT_867343 [Obelidium mucronatum]|nr:hypothetical protein BDR26DRAFT_867343 [Obelidium mucronatum]
MFVRQFAKALIIISTANCVSSSFTAGSQITASASASTDNVTISVCLNAPLERNSWVGIGFPADRTSKDPVMEGADLILFYSSVDGTAGTPNLLIGKGLNHAFSTNEQLANLKVNAAKSTYSNGILNACVDLPASAVKVLNGPASYMIAAGAMSASYGKPLQHTENYVVTNANLFGTKAATTTGATATSFAKEERCLAVMAVIFVLSFL